MPSPGGVAEVERIIVTGSPIIVTGSNIPTAEEVGPKPQRTLIVRLTLKNWAFGTQRTC